MEKVSQAIRKFAVPEQLFGVNARQWVSRYARSFGGRRVLIVSDHGIARSGWLEELEADLRAAGIPFAHFLDVTPNPKDIEVTRGVSFFRQTESDIIVALGGGSAMDMGKAIGVCAINQRDIHDFEGIDAIPLPGPPLICVATTAGTASEVSQFTIINDTTRKLKMSVVSKKIVPDCAVLDPVLTTTMPPALTSATGLDALVHAVEACVSTAASHLTSIHALEAIRLVTQWLERAVHEPQNMDARTGMLMGSLLAGYAFSNASLGLVHAMAHSLGGMFDLPHGECNAKLLEVVVDFNFDSAQAQYRNIASAMGIPVEGMTGSQVHQALAGQIRRLRASVGLEKGLSDNGLNKSAIPALSGYAKEDACEVTNPREATTEEIGRLYESAW